MIAPFRLILRFTCLVGGLAVMAGCYREATDSTGVSRYTGTAPWTIDGIRPGQSLDDARRLLGEPRDIRESMGQRVVRWSSSETIVTTNTAGEILEIWGRSLSAGGQSLVQTGLSEAQVAQVLGRGKSTRLSTPSGFVISFGSKTTGHIFTYRNDGVTFEITVKEDSVQHVRAFRP